MTALGERRSTAVAAAPGSWDPLIRPVAIAVMAVLLAFNASAIDMINGVALPNTIPLLVAFMGIGLAIIVPRHDSVIIPMAPAALMVVLVGSVWWSHDPDASMLWLRTRGVGMIAIALLALVLSNHDVISALKVFVGAVLLLNVVAVVIDPLAREHIDPTGESPPLEGWHGWFIHKNTMAAFMILALPVVLAFYRKRIFKWPALAIIAALMAGSSSTTGRSAIMVQLAIMAWFVINRRLSNRASVAVGMSTAAVSMVALIAIVNSLAAIADAAGKDLTFTGRTDIWAAVIDKIWGSPFIGYGVKGLFSSPATNETLELIRHIGFKAGHAHNGLLDLALQLGVVGVVIVAIIIVGLFRMPLAEMRRSRSVPMFVLMLITGICVMSVGESTLLDSTVAVAFVAQTLSLRTHRSNERRREVTVRRRSPQQPATGVGSSGSGFSGSSDSAPDRP